MRKDKMLSGTLGDELALTPTDVYEANLPTTLFGGYRRDEVDSLLERAGDALDRLIERVRAQAARIDELQQEVAGYRESEVALRDALMSAQRFGDQLIESARSEADTLIREARMQQAEYRARAADMPHELRQEIQILEQQRLRLRAELLAVLETHRQLVDTLIPQARGDDAMDGFFETTGAPAGDAARGDNGATQDASTTGASEEDAVDSADAGDEPDPGETEAEDLSETGPDERG